MRDPARERTVVLRHCVPKRAPYSTVLSGKPAYGLKCDLGRDRMSPIELAVDHVVATMLQFGNDPAAAAVYWQHPVARSVGDEDARGAHLPSRSHEPRRERDHVREEVPVGDPQ